MPTAAEYSSKTLTDSDIWRKCADDVERAQKMFDEGKNLPFWAWSAMVGLWTEEHTCQLCTTWDGRITGVVSDISHGLGNASHNGRRWERPENIARRGSVWDRASEGEMSRWILLLEDASERAAASRANGVPKDDSYTEEDLIALEVQRSQIRRKMLTVLPNFG